MRKPVPKPVTPDPAERMERLARISTFFTTERDEAVSARRDTGIEKVWQQAEEAYLGIDDANRSEFTGANWAKPTALSGPVTTGYSRFNDGRSTVFIRLTSRYVDAGAAKLQEILLPIDGKPFTFTASPIAEGVAEFLDDARNVMLDNGQPATRELKPEEVVQQPGMPAQPTEVPLKVKDLAQEKQELADKKAKKAEKRIYDWMVESQYPAEMRKVIFDMARIGVGIIKGPIPQVRRKKAVKKDKAGETTLLILDKTVPGYEWRDPWNIYPDASCGENIQHGSYLYEKDFLSDKQLRNFMRDPTYLKEQVKKVLDEGPSKTQEGGTLKLNPENKKGRYTVWYRYGQMTREQMQEIYCCKPDEKFPEGETFHAIMTMVNDTVIKAVFSPLDSGELPYHACPWQRRAGHWAGVGVAEQIFAPQRIVNASTRALLNNAGKSAGSQIVVKQGVIVPADGEWIVFPDKVWYALESAALEDIRQAFQTFVIPNVTPAMLSIIEFGYRTAEESTSIPLITQGQTGPTTPDTFGAAQLQNNNANQLLRSVGYAVDDYITDPVVRQSYELLLLDPDIPDDEKGDFDIDAHGSAALVERAIQDQTIAQMGPMVLNPAYGVDPQKWLQEWLKSKRLNPKDFQYTEAEIEKMRSTPPPPPPQLAAAQIRAQTDVQIAQMREQGAMARDATDTDRDRAYVQAETQRTEREHEARMAELNAKLQLAQLDYASKRELTLEEVKAKLADTTIKANLQRELASMNGAGQALKPPTEPPGRAAPGRAYEQ